MAGSGKIPRPEDRRASFQDALADVRFGIDACNFGKQLVAAFTNETAHLLERGGDPELSRRFRPNNGRGHHCYRRGCRRGREGWLGLSSVILVKKPSDLPDGPRSVFHSL